MTREPEFGSTDEHQDLQVLGHRMVSDQGTVIGRVNDVLIDEGSADDRWAVVSTGLLRSEHFVPLERGVPRRRRRRGRPLRQEHDQARPPRRRARSDPAGAQGARGVLRHLVAAAPAGCHEDGSALRALRLSPRDSCWVELELDVDADVEFVLDDLLGPRAQRIDTNRPPREGASRYREGPRRASRRRSARAAARSPEPLGDLRASWIAIAGAPRARLAIATGSPTSWLSIAGR